MYNLVSVNVNNIIIVLIKFNASLLLITKLLDLFEALFGVSVVDPCGFALTWLDWWTGDGPRGTIVNVANNDLKQPLLIKIIKQLDQHYKLTLESPLESLISNKKNYCNAVECVIMYQLTAHLLKRKLISSKSNLIFS